MTDLEFSASVAKDIKSLLKNKELLYIIGMTDEERMVLGRTSSHLLYQYKMRSNMKRWFETRIDVFGVLVMKEDLDGFKCFERVYEIDTTACDKKYDMKGNLSIKHPTNKRECKYIYDPSDAYCPLRLNPVYGLDD